MTRSFLIDTSRCTACRGCQIACKEWHELPANKTRQAGTHQNPPDLNPNNYKVVRFSEYMDDEGVIHWNFFPDQCRHCLEPACFEAASEILDGAIVHDRETGAVLFTEKTKQLSEEECEDINLVCPYNIPRRDPETGLMSKCTMCHERVSRGLVPVCVQVCPTGAMNFGDRKAMLDLAEKRLKEVQKEHPLAKLADPEDVSVIYLLADKRERYYKYASAPTKIGIDRKTFLARLLKPLVGRGKGMTRI